MRAEVSASAWPLASDGTRFAAVAKRFEDLQGYLDKRLDSVDKRFEDMNKRFEDMNKRFSRT